jgi:hypothetical protein
MKILREQRGEKQNEKKMKSQELYTRGGGKKETKNTHI